MLFILRKSAECEKNIENVIKNNTFYFTRDGFIKLPLKILYKLKNKQIKKKNILINNKNGFVFFSLFFIFAMCKRKLRI